MERTLLFSCFKGISMTQTLQLGNRLQTGNESFNASMSPPEARLLGDGLRRPPPNRSFMERLRRTDGPLLEPNRRRSEGVRPVRDLCRFKGRW